MKNGSRLKFAENLLILERGSDELLLFNVLEQRPLYIKQGGQYIKTFLKAAGRLSTRKKIIQSYPREKRLLDVMLEYGILETDGAGHRSERLEASPGLATSGGKKHMSLYLLLSQSCNMRCVYCLDGQRTYQTAKNLRMSKEVAYVLNLQQSQRLSAERQAEALRQEESERQAKSERQHEAVKESQPVKQTESVKPKETVEPKIQKSQTIQERIEMARRRANQNQQSRGMRI